MEIFDYDNVLLLPRKCRVESRSECDASVELGGRSFRIPVVPANMKTVVDESICTWMAQNGYFYVMHRFDLDNLQFVRETLGVCDTAYILDQGMILDHGSPERIAASPKPPAAYLAAHSPPYRAAGDAGPCQAGVFAVVGVIGWTEPSASR